MDVGCVLAKIVLVTSFSLLAALKLACGRGDEGAAGTSLGATAKVAETAGTTDSVGVNNFAPTPLSDVEVR